MSFVRNSVCKCTVAVIHWEKQNKTLMCDTDRCRKMWEAQEEETLFSEVTAHCSASENL